MTPFSIVLVWTVGENALKSTRFQLVWTSENGKQTLAWTILPLFGLTKTETTENA